MENKLDIVQEKKFFELVPQFPVLFDNFVKGYKGKDPEVNAWNENTNSLNFIPNGLYYILATI